MTKISYVKNQDIDYTKWDNCLVHSPNRQIYATSWYLDHVADRWGALVLGDYDFVMPLPIRKKWGISYVFHPKFSQQLGIFPVPTEEIAAMFYTKLQQTFRYFDTQINAKNPVGFLTENKITISQRSNYLLPLNMNYAGLFSGYTANTRKNLRKAHKKNLVFVSGIRLEDYLKLKAENSWKKIGPTEWNTLKSLIAKGQYKGIGRICGIYTQENELCAAGYFCQYGNRVTFLNSVANEAGKKSEAMRMLIDEFIKQNAGKNLILDFEGSMIPGIAFFFKGFGSYPETYFQLKYNRLPLLVRWIKR
ncbi:MAG: hypothetical protein ACK5M7_18945 [Draconibacterium sp.]